MKITLKQLRRLIEQEVKEEEKLSDKQKKAAEDKIEDEGGALGKDDFISTINDADPDVEYSEEEALSRADNSIEDFEIHQDGDVYTNRPTKNVSESLTRKNLRRLIKEELKRLSYASKEQGHTYGIEHLPDQYDKKKADDR